MTTSARSFALRQVQRVAAYAVLRHEEGVLMVRASPSSVFAGRWALPGGSVHHGEHPRETVARATYAETGVSVQAGRALEATSDVVDLPHEGLRLHTLRVLFEVTAVTPPQRGSWGPPPGDRLREPGASAHRAGVDRVEFATPATAAAWPLMPYAARLLGLAVPELPAPGGGAAPAAVPGPHTPGAGAPRLQRPAAYALVVEEDRLLLSRLSGRVRHWTMPGGGIDFGEDPADAVRREVYEETGLPLTPGALLDVDSTHFVGRNHAGVHEDYHGIRLLYAGTVPPGLTPATVEVDGSTEEAAWIPLDQVAHTPRVGLVDVALRHLA